MKYRIQSAFLVLILGLIGSFLSACGGSSQDLELTSKDREALVKALKEDEPVTVQKYLDKGMNPNQTDENGKPYIVTAIREGRSDIVRALLNGRADVLEKRERPGTLGLVEATPASYREKGRFTIRDQGWPSWSHPAIAGGRLYIRNQGTLTTYNIRAS
jgi:hypothetical protein